MWQHALLLPDPKDDGLKHDSEWIVKAGKDCGSFTPPANVDLGHYLGSYYQPYSSSYNGLDLCCV